MKIKIHIEDLDTGNDKSCIMTVEADDMEHLKEKVEDMIGDIIAYNEDDRKDDSDYDNNKQL